MARYPVALEAMSLRLAIVDGPGVYLLLNARGEVVYVGRADSSLRRRLFEHLPHNETNAKIRAAKPTAVLFAHTSVEQAYRLETRLKGIYQPECNKIEPAIPHARFLDPFPERHSLVDALLGI